MISKMQEDIILDLILGDEGGLHEIAFEEALGVLGDEDAAQDFADSFIDYVMNFSIDKKQKEVI